MGNRRRAREVALKILYSLEFESSRNVEKALRLFWEMEPIALKAKIFASDMVSGTFAHIDEIDALLEKHAKNWTLKRMSHIDRNILRFSVYGLIYRNDIPVRVTINEALEIAKKYGSDNSSRFINGLLDVILKDKSVSKKNMSAACGSEIENA